MDLDWTLSDDGLQVSEKHRDDISKKRSEQNTEGSTKAYQGLSNDP